MSVRSTVSSALVALAAQTSACAAAPRCATGPTGALVRWAEVAIDPTARFAVLPASAHAPAAFDASAGVVVVRFDPAALGDAPTIERAALLLVPSPAARRERCAWLRVRAVDEPWSAAAVEAGAHPALTGDAAEVTLPPQRVPVRVDVTALVRALGPEGLARRGLAVTATEAGAVFRGSATLSAEERPRLEVLLR